jgi:hypothetical protein
MGGFDEIYLALDGTSFGLPSTSVNFRFNKMWDISWLIKEKLKSSRSLLHEGIGDVGPISSGERTAEIAGDRNGSRKFCLLASTN